MVPRVSESARHQGVVMISMGRKFQVLGWAKYTDSRAALEYFTNLSIERYIMILKGKWNRE